MIERFKKLFADSDFSELFSQAGISLILRICGQAAGFVLTLVIARYFGASGLGDYVLAIAVLRGFSIISKLGLDIFSVRFIASFVKKKMWKSIIYFKRRIEILLIFTCLLCSLIMYFFSSEIAALINAQVFHIKLNSFLILPMTFFILNYQCLRGLKKIAHFSFYFRVSQALFSIVCIFVFVQFFKNDDIPIFAYLCSLLIVFILSTYSFKKSFHLKKNIQQSESVEKFKIFDMLKISLPIMIAQLVQFIMAWTDKLMLGNMMDSDQVGIYFTAFKLSMLASLSLMAINSIAGPKFAEMFSKNDFSSLKKVVHQSTEIIFWTTIPFVIIFFIFPQKIMLLFGDEFKIGSNALMILSLAKLISSFSGSVGNILQMTGNQFVYMIILSIGALCNVVLNYYLIPIYSIEGAAIASLLSMSLWNLGMVYFIKKEFGFYTFYNPFR